MAERPDLIKFDRLRVLSWIIEYKTDNGGYSPNLEQIKIQFEMGSRSVARNVVQSLIKMGFVESFTKVSGIKVAGETYIGPDMNSKPL